MTRRLAKSKIIWLWLIFVIVTALAASPTWSVSSNTGPTMS